MAPGLVVGSALRPGLEFRAGSAGTPTLAVQFPLPQAVLVPRQSPSRLVATMWWCLGIRLPSSRTREGPVPI
ncbi:hypothetical protein OIE13_09595 [Streptosporangium sp. NBC_01810]|uniref:hypothetical protein n=1 Tax=Streptosporangium sp. NBC_01810 TaxID=2975951 RepID=UPI002DDABBE9|nr:hypothetical protein [Streptosporangium sp. NBC_01810]WSA28091.1 hypothetical protein OIE13_09595 [Streptosporangium sp. NBC_01810]